MLFVSRAAELADERLPASPEMIGPLAVVVAAGAGVAVRPTVQVTRQAPIKTLRKA